MESQSRNVWIKEGDPSKLGALYKDGYEDILEERRHTSDFRWCTRSRNVQFYQYRHPRNPKQIKDSVLSSDRVQYAIEQVIQESGTTPEETENQVHSILDEMAHNLNLSSVRCLAYVLTKIIKRLYRRIYVNEEGIDTVRTLIKEYPVLLMPSHRSYTDFLVMSYLFYHYDLPLPVIAAAMDFMGMKFVGTLLRNCGAFFIRRSFGSDKLYWAVFTEYVQTQMCNGDAPVEFYVEGTRSRTSKSLSPKIGMLKASLEPYFKAHCPDIMVIPITVSYDRILEENLYTYELLGVPKPKESTSGLLKARSILSEDFGNIHICLAPPISIRTFSEGKINRHIHSLSPRYIASLTKDEEVLLKDLAFVVILTQQKHAVISPWALIASVLMQKTNGVQFEELVKDVEWLKRQASNCGAYVDWPGNESPEHVIRTRLLFHSNKLTISDEDLVELKQISPPSHVDNKTSKDTIISTAAMHVMTSLYRNQLLHVFVRIAMVTIPVNSCLQETLSINSLFEQYTFLETILSREFIFQPGKTREDFNKVLVLLQHAGGLVIDEERNIKIKQSVNKYTTFMSIMFKPFLLGYWVVCQYLLSLAGGNLDARPLARKAKQMRIETQQLILGLLSEGIIKHYEILSLDLIGNALDSLVDMGVISREKRIQDIYFVPQCAKVSRIAAKIESMTEVPATHITDFSTFIIRTVTAKL